MPFWLTLLLFVGATIAQELLRPRAKFGSPQPSSLGEFQVPTAQEGRPIPVVFGTVKMAGPNVVWYGDLLVRPVTKKVKTGLFSSQKITTGHQYYIGAQLVLCHGPIDELLEVRFDDRPVPFTYATTIYSPREPSQSGWGLIGAATVAEAIDEPPVRRLLNALFATFEIVSHDGDDTCIQGADATTGATVGARWSHGSPSSLSHVGWKLHFFARQSGIGNAPDDDLSIYIDSVFVGTPPVFSTGTLVRFEAHFFSTRVGPTYQAAGQEIVIELTEAEAAQIAAGTNLSVLLRSHGFGAPATVGVTHRCTQVWLEVPGHPDNDPMTIEFASPKQFGGEEGEGGIVGLMDIHKGSLTQTANGYLTGLLGPLPAYRGVAYAVMRQMYVSTTPYLKPIAFVIRRTPNTLGLTDGRNNIGGDANPAAMLYEVLTNARWGLGIPTAQIETASFIAAGNLLASESFGLSMTFDQGSPARDFMAEILRHIDAVIYTDPATGLVKIKMIRADYGPTDPLRLDVYNMGSCGMSRPAWDDTSNVAKVSYVDRAGNFVERVAQAMDLANLQVRGGDIAEEQFAFRGISNGDIAQKMAARVLKTISYPIAVLEIECNRVAWSLRPGDVVRVTWAPLGISDMVCRITRIATGSLLNGTIRIDAVEDIFGISGTAYTAPGSTSWVDPTGPPTGLAAAALLEAPYALVVGPERVVMTLGAQGAQALLGYQVWADANGGTAYVHTADVLELTPSSTLAADLWYTNNQIRIAAAAGISLLEYATADELAAGRNVLLIGAELIAWQGISLQADGSMLLSGIVRGVADTVPSPHSTGDRVWFITEGHGLATQAALQSDVTLSALLPAFTSYGVQDGADVSPVSITTASRALRPYVPRNVLVNGVAYPTALQPYSDISVAWAHRNRLSEWSWADGGLVVTPETGTTYRVRFYGPGDVLFREYTGITGTSQTWTTEAADSGGSRNESVRITVEAIVGGVASFQAFDFTVWRSMGVQGLASGREAAIATARRKRKWRRRVHQRDGEDDVV